MTRLIRPAAALATLLLGGLVGLGGCSVDGEITTRADRTPPSPTGVGLNPADSPPPIRPVQRISEPADPQPAAVGSMRYVLAYPTGQRSSSVLLLEADEPSEVRIGQRLVETLRVTNLTAAPLHGVSVYTVVADSISNTDRARRQPPGEAPDVRPAASQPAFWNVGSLGPHESKTRQLESTADEVGVLRRCLGVTYTPSLCTSVTVVKPELQLTKEGPAEILICQDLTYRYAVTNTGTGTATAVRVDDALPEGLSTDAGQQAVALDLGDLPEGQTKSVVVKLRAAHVGRYVTRAVARSGDATGESRDIVTVVREPVLALAVQGPDARYANEAVDFRVTVRNTGDAPAEHAIVRLSSPDVDEKFADQDLGILQPNASKTLTITTRAGSVAGRLQLTAVAEAACAHAVTERGTVAIRTIPALLLECGDSIDPVRVGNRTVYTITVVNQGSGADSQVTVKAFVPPEEQYVGSTGPSIAKVDGQVLNFEPIATLAPKQTVQWKVEVSGAKAGDARFNVELTSDSLTRPALKSESTRVVDDAAAPVAK